ncbi:MAG: ABC transporter substrate-binding protein [Actinomycetota bacterium]|nr:ABC transporter substrate-binding protein [Actinomycetota bacterium]
MPAQLKSAAADKLTIATSQPTYEPWMVGNDPTNGRGFESAVAYAVAGELGYTKNQVSWKRVDFEEAIAKQEGWDFDINQFSITDARKKVVDFSSGYYDIAQAVITVKGSKIAGATTVAALKDVKLGAMNGTTSLDAVNNVIKPSNRPNVFKDNSLATQALQNGQVAGLVVDLPTAFELVGAELKGGVMVGQLPNTASTKEQFGLLLAKNSPMTGCATKAVDALRANGTLAALTAKWLGGKGNAPILK